MSKLILFFLVATTVNLLAGEDRATVLARELPKLTGDYRATELKKPGPETPLARRYYTLLNRYVPYIEKNMKDWPGEAGAKFHKKDGSLEHAVRQNASVALALSVLTGYGDFDARAAGVSRIQARADAVALVRYLAVTHVANFLPTGDGKQWGDQWQSAYWAGIAGTAAWLMWDDLPDATKVMAARMIIHEADRYNTRPPDNGEAHDTKAEENAWNSEVIALAACMFQNHPRAGLWRERAIVYMINSFSAAADQQDGRIVDGKPIKDRVTTTNIHADFTVENHNRVHADYLSCFTLNLQNAILYALAGLKTPAAAFHHAKESNEVLLYLTATNGSLFYINGQDWYPHRHDVALTTSGLMSALLPDADTAGVERCALAWLEKMHSRFKDGRALDPREYNYPSAEEENMVIYSANYLAHRLFGEHAQPVSAREFQAHQSGTRIFEAGGFVTHRTPEKFVSFCWVNGAMGLVYPSDDTWFTAPFERGLVGRITVEGMKDTPPEVEAHTVRPLRLTGPDANDGFAFVGKFSRCEGSIEQRVAVISLPGTPVVYVERLRARRTVNVKEIATGTVAILNEDAKPIVSNERQVWTATGKYRMQGASNQRPKLHVWNTTWANVDEKLGLVARASGKMSYLENHGYERARLQQELAANYLAAVGARKAGEIISEAVVALLPNAAHTQTQDLRMEHLGADGFSVRIVGWQILVNLGDSELEAARSGPALKLAALSATVQKADD